MRTRFCSQLHSYTRMENAREPDSVPNCIPTPEWSMHENESLFPTAFIHPNAVCKEHTLVVPRTRLRAIPNCGHTPECSKYKRTRLRRFPIILRSVPSCIHIQECMQGPASGLFHTPECNIQGPHSGLFLNAFIH
jgi:hypothetical protein